VKTVTEVNKKSILSDNIEEKWCQTTREVRHWVLYIPTQVMVVFKANV